MTVDNLSPGQMPAGFTYLGQFIDHDLTFDKSALMEGVDISPATLEQSRSPEPRPRLAVRRRAAGSGLGEVLQGDGIHLKMGAARRWPAAGLRPAAADARRSGEAIIPDPRNDENLAVAQTHLAFIRFHNRVVDTLPAAVPPAQRFHEARKIVTKHYQWMIRTDYLPRICAPAVVTNVFSHGRKAFEVGAAPTSMPTMPIEFSVAAFRLGHSMVRAEYSWNKVFPDATLGQLFEFAHLSGGLARDPTPEHLDRGLPPALQLRPALAGPPLVVPPAKFNRRCGSTRSSSTRCGRCRSSPTRPARTTSPSATCCARTW